MAEQVPHMKVSSLKMESYRRGAVWSSFYNLIAQTVGFAASMVLAYYFGLQAKTDVYYYALAVVALMSGFISSINSSVLIPESMRIEEQQGRAQAMDFLNHYLYLFLALGLLVTVVMFINPVHFFIAISRFDVLVLREHSSIVTWTVPLFILLLIAQYLVDVLSSRKYFTVPMLLAILNRVILLICVILFSRGLDILSAVIGGLIATALQIVVSLWLMKSSLGWDFRFRWVRQDKSVLRNVAFAQIGNFTSLLSSYVPLFLLSSFSGGVLTALNYGQRLASVPALLITTQVSAVIGIKMNELHARHDGEGINHFFLQSGRRLLFLLIPISVFLFIYAQEVVAVFYRRGAFDAVAVNSSSLFFRFFVLSLPFLAVNTLVARLFMATQKIKEGVCYQIALNTVLCVLTVIGVHRLGAIGYPVAQLVLNVMNVFVLYVLLRFVRSSLSYGRVLYDFGRMAGFNLVFAVMALGVRELTMGFNSWVSLFLGLTAFGLLFAIGHILVPLDESINQRGARYLRKLGLLPVASGPVGK